MLFVYCCTATSAAAAPLVDDHTQYLMPVLNPTVGTTEELTLKLRKCDAEVLGVIGDFKPFYKTFVIKIRRSNADKTQDDAVRRVLINIQNTRCFSPPNIDFLYRYQNAIPPRPTDPYFPNQLHLPQMQVPEARAFLAQYRIKVEPVTIALLDNCAPNGRNADLQGQTLPVGFDAVNNRVKVFGTMGGSHAARLASTMCAAQNRIGIVGVNPTAKIYPIYVGENGSVRESTLMRAIEHCHQRGIRVICAGVNPGFAEAVNRFGGGKLHDYADTFMVGTAYFTEITGYKPRDNRFGLMFCPIGNDGRDKPYGVYNGPIEVAAMNRNGTALAGFSNRGPMAMLSAPGENVYCSDEDGRVVAASGSSLAAANAAGVASILLGVNPALKSRDALYFMRQTYQPTGMRPVNALQSIQKMLQTSR